MSFVEWFEAYRYIYDNVLATIDIAINNEENKMLDAMRGRQHYRTMSEQKDHIDLLKNLRGEIEHYLTTEFEKTYNYTHDERFVKKTIYKDYVIEEDK